MIMKKTSGGGHTVLPIFYDVPPSHVRYQTGSFTSSFNKHKEKFKTQTDKINQWRDALIDATKLAGMELSNGYESHFIEDVVREIRNKLHPGKLDLTPHLVGTNLRVEKINSWLQDEAHDASMAIIYGRGGVGKTTIAKIVYNENLERFDSGSFVANVRDLSKKPKSLIRLQNRLLSDILKGKIHEVCNIEDVVKIQNAICCKKVLIIFDDIDESDQLDALLGRRRIQFLPGSKIILTTRNEGLLRTNQVFEKFQIIELDKKDSLQLFSWHAFGQNHPIDGYLECSMEAAYRCEGLPLALEVFGSSLSGRNVDVWKDALQKLKIFPNTKIQRILRISYDSLKDDHDQNLFLDIACFFVGMENNYVSGILNGRGFHTLFGIQNLVERCLLSVNKNNELRMHRLLIDMGREIVCQESTNDPGRRSRLWNRRDACTVLQDKASTKEIRGLVLDLYRLVGSSYGSTNTDLSYEEQELASSHSFPLDLQTESFVEMRNIQFLQLYEIAVSPHTFDVFLSFRGQDTRKHFTDHLYTALKQAGFHTFRGEEELVRGENIEAELQKAIRESKISVIVFSKDYASSTWCLDALVMIMKKMSGGGHTVLPIFYDVPPSHVRYQTGSFASAFSKHMEQSRKETDKINQWRVVLKDTADLAGMELSNRYESHFIQDVVREIRNKLHPGKLDLTPHLVGTNLTVEKINSWLQDKAHDASMAIIFGIGGVGKTTIAKIVYNENLKRFDSSSFVANVRDLSKKPKSLIRLQNRLLTDILKGKIHEVCNVDGGIVKIQNAICCKKVLIIFDDVDESGELDALLGRRRIHFFPGSKIILTTRNEGLLRTNQVFEKFQVEGLDENDSLQLFSWHAFGQNHPIDSYLDCSKEAAYRCGGLPLALEIFGSSLFGRNIDVWKDALQKLKTIPNSKIQQILRISYDSLKDDHDQNLFLHIAFFFVGNEKNYVSEILKGCGFSTLFGSQNLVDRCLLSVDKNNELRMHQLLKEMGREIVRQESTNDPGRRSRLWNCRDVCTVLQDKSGTKEIRGLVLDLYRLVGSSYGSKNTDLSYEEQELASSHSFPLDFQTESFVEMRNIQFLQLYGVNVKGNYEDLPKNLVLLCWHGFPLRSIPSNFHLKKLVSLDLSYSDIKNVWDGTMDLPELKFLNLSHCRELTRMPNFDKLPCLERLIFTGCIRIFEVDESIESLKRLLILNLKDCTSLRRLPKNFSTLESLEEIDLSGCSNLYKLPEDLGEMKSLKVFHGSGIAINRFLSTTTSTVTRVLSLLSSTLWHPTIQSWLTLRKHSRSTNFSLASLPSSLVRLSLEHCNLYDDTFPNFSILGSLKYLNLSGNPFHDLPEGISDHNMLKELVIDGCTGIQSLQKLPIDLFLLQANYCSSLERLESRILREVKFSFFEQCDKLVSIQDWFKVYSINDIDKAILKSLAFSDLESPADIKVDMFNRLTSTTKTTSLQLGKIISKCNNI